MQNMLHNYKIGCISASQTIVITGIFLLIWAFGSYLVYVLTVPNPILCFPPLSGCVTISHAGDYPFSGFFYRLLKNTQQSSLADALVIEHKSLSELDDVHNIINWNEIEQTPLKPILVSTCASCRCRCR
jgi:hypothetical protein